jgi:DNA-directed RNA polymerase subunit omega
VLKPAIEDLMDKTLSKFGLVTLASRRAREINAYYNQLGEGLGNMVPPQVSSTALKPLTVSFEEISAGKIVGIPKTLEEIEAEAARAAAEAEAAEAQAAVDAAASTDA